MDNKVTIKLKSKTFEIGCTYHSDIKCKDYDASMTARLESDGRVTFVPVSHFEDGFIFDQSDPDVVLAIAKMMQEFAEYAKHETRKGIDTSTNA